MVVFVSISIGLFIAIFSLIMIRREVMKASFFKHVKLSDSISDDVIKRIQAIEVSIEEMNQSYYDIVGDLEGKYSVHEKELEILENKMNEATQLAKELSRMLNYQGKEIASIREPVVQETITEETTETDSLQNEILRLHSLGYDEYQIAKKLNKGVREIKMIMNFIK
jgi:hypothetical protein